MSDLYKDYLMHSSSIRRIKVPGGGVKKEKSKNNRSNSHQINNAADYNKRKGNVSSLGSEAPGIRRRGPSTSGFHSADEKRKYLEEQVAANARDSARKRRDTAYANNQISGNSSATAQTRIRTSRTPERRRRDTAYANNQISGNSSASEQARIGAPANSDNSSHSGGNGGRFSSKPGSRKANRSRTGNQQQLHYSKNDPYAGLMMLLNTALASQGGKAKLLNTRTGNTEVYNAHELQVVLDVSRKIASPEEIEEYNRMDPQRVEDILYNTMVTSSQMTGKIANKLNRK